MDDLIRRQAAIRWVKTECNPYGKPTLDFESGKKVLKHLEQMPSAEPEIIYCRDCINHIDKRCIEADHHTSDNECCMSVFHAERRTDE